MEIDGDEFAECDYGLVVDNNQGIQELQQKLDTLAQAALQNHTLSFSTIMKLFMSASIAEKQRFVEADEQRIKQEQAQQQQQQLQLQQQQIQANVQAQEEERKAKDQMNQRDNETRIMVAEINSQAEMAILQLKNHMTVEDEIRDGILEPEEYSQEAKDKLMESMRQFDAKLKLDRDKFEFEKQKTKTDQDIKRSQIAAKKNT